MLHQKQILISVESIWIQMKNIKSKLPALDPVEQI